MSDTDEEVGRLNVRLPQDKLDWLREELDSFTSDTGRIQYLIQYYSDHHATDDEASNR